MKRLNRLIETAIIVALVVGIGYVVWERLQPSGCPAELLLRQPIIDRPAGDIAKLTLFERSSSIYGDSNTEITYTSDGKLNQTVRRSETDTGWHSTTTTCFYNRRGWLTGWRNVCRDWRSDAAIDYVTSRREIVITGSLGFPGGQVTLLAPRPMSARASIRQRLSSIWTQLRGSRRRPSSVGEIIELDSKNRCKRVDTKTGSGTETQAYDYDASDHIVRAIVDVHFTRLYKYNAKGLVVEERIMNPIKLQQCLYVTRSTYKYDSRGNWIWRRSITTGTKNPISRVTTCQITYRQ